MTTYKNFLATKRAAVPSFGFDVKDGDIHPMLFDWQRAIVRWAVKKGRAAIFADTGLGKTFMQVEWARLIGERTLIIAPLSVARQTVRESAKIDTAVSYVRQQSDVNGKSVYITNYEMVDEFDPAQFGAVVLDESSILKSLDGKTRRKLTDMFAKTPYRLCCTATPAPNDQSEIGQHSEFLGVLTMADMLSSFFVHDEQEWRLKGHAANEFYHWLASWSMAVRKPSDIGYLDDGYELPPLTIEPIVVPNAYTPEGTLFHVKMHGITDRTKVRRATLDARTTKAAAMVSASGEQWIVWCGLEAESERMRELIPGAIEVRGSDEPESKAEALEAFQNGEYRVLITKPRIAGFGMNFQNAHNMVFVGINDSWESYYQCIRRCYRFGQTKPVNAYIVISDVEMEIYDNIMRKEKEARIMTQQLIEHVAGYEREELKGRGKVAITKAKKETVRGETFTLMLGDSCERLSEVESDSVALSVYSPPFADLYTYSPSERDLGNSSGWETFFQHYAFIIQDLLRVTKPGRLTAVHTSDIPAMLVKNGYIGLRDFPGAVVKAYESAGWIFHGRITIDKDPQAQAIRTKSKALLFVQLEKDSSWSRPAIGDYILIFRKPGENDTPIQPVAHGEITRDQWIEWARPIWYHIRESDTLQYTTARESDDEKHICPLQLGTIERCIKLWSNPGETVLTPFMGIGSETYQAVRFGRKAIGIELKEAYFRVAVTNVQEAARASKQVDLFEAMGVEV